MQLKHEGSTSSTVSVGSGCKVALTASYITSLILLNVFDEHSKNDLARIERHNLSPSVV